MRRRSSRGMYCNETGAGLAGVNVTWENATTGEFYGNFTTLDDPAGYYTMVDLFDGSRESLITASKAGYITNSTVKTITAGSPPKYHWINFTLYPTDTTAPRTNVTAPSTLWPGKPNETTIPSATPLPWTNKPVTLWFITMMIIENYLYTLEEIERRCAP